MDIHHSRKERVRNPVSGKKGKVGDYSKVNDGKGSTMGKGKAGYEISTGHQLLIKGDSLVPPSAPASVKGSTVRWDPLFMDFSYLLSFVIIKFV